MAAISSNSISINTGCIDYDKIPLRALNVSCRRQLSISLLPDRPLPTSMGITRDWQGLGELAGLSYDTIKLYKTLTEPVIRLLDTWSDSEANPTFGELMNKLEMMERFDVIADIQPLIEKDALAYIKTQEREQQILDTVRPIQDSRISSGEKTRPPMYTVGDFVRFNSVANEVVENETSMNTSRHSVMIEEPERYDAYVSFVEADFPFVETMIAELEGIYKLKLYIKDRDMLFGVVETEADLCMINERCEKILLIISEDAINNSRCEFQAVVAQASALDNLHTRKVIPIKYKPCILPSRYKYLAWLDYTKSDKFANFWKRLAYSIKGQHFEGCTSRSGSPYLFTQSETGSSLVLPSQAGSVSSFSSQTSESSISSAMEMSHLLPSLTSSRTDQSILLNNSNIGKRSRPTTPDPASVGPGTCSQPVASSTNGSPSPPSQSSTSTRKRFTSFFTRSSS